MTTAPPAPGKPVQEAEPGRWVVTGGLGALGIISARYMSRLYPEAAALHPSTIEPATACLQPVMRWVGAIIYQAQQRIPCQRKMIAYYLMCAAQIFH